mmetsp:Transcript_94602/g.272382  ORF Transcript_94602/g.272382 Transcript_94602/m.272382 type:complete len:276 (-) Transcript_94602:393-1220(-)
MVDRVLVRAVALGAAARAHRRAAPQKSPHLRFLLVERGLQAIGHDVRDLRIAQQHSDLVNELLRKPGRVLDVKVGHHGEALEQQGPAGRLPALHLASCGGHVPDRGLEVGQLAPVAHVVRGPTSHQGGQCIQVGPELRDQQGPLDAGDGNLALLEQAGEDLMQVGIHIKGVLDNILPISFDEGLLVGALGSAGSVWHIREALRPNVRRHSDERLVQPLAGQGVEKGPSQRGGARRIARAAAQHGNELRLRLLPVRLEGPPLVLDAPGFGLRQGVE